MPEAVRTILSYFHGIDPAAALLADGEVLAYAEEERLIRHKHAPHVFPLRSIKACLELAGRELAGRGLLRLRLGRAALRRRRHEPLLRGGQRAIPAGRGHAALAGGCLRQFAPKSLRSALEGHLVRGFGIRPEDVPELVFYPHHRTHAAAAFYLSPFDEALVLTLDGSGDGECTVLWRGTGSALEPLHEIDIPQLARLVLRGLDRVPRLRGLRRRVQGDGTRRLRAPEPRDARAARANGAPGPEGLGLRGRAELHPPRPPHLLRAIHRPAGRSSSGLPPRQGPRPLEPIHEDIAFETQRLLEETVLRLRRALPARDRAHSPLHRRRRGSERQDEQPHPAERSLRRGVRVPHTQRFGARDRRRGRPAGSIDAGSGPPRSSTSTWAPAGPTKTSSNKSGAAASPIGGATDIASDTARILADGKVVGWFQGRLEGGPRALGGRSILADPRRSRRATV